MPAEFPLPSVSAANPTPESFEAMPEEFVVSRTIYDDNGADTALQVGGVGVKTWVIRYNGLTKAEADILDNWAATMFYSSDNGSAFGSAFREHIQGTVYTDTSGTLYSGVHISPGGYKRSHSKTWAQVREFTLEKRS